MQKHENIFEGVRGVNLKNLLKTLGHHFDLTYKNEVDIIKLSFSIILSRFGLNSHHEQHHSEGGRVHHQLNSEPCVISSIIVLI